MNMVFCFNVPSFHVRLRAYVVRAANSTQVSVDRILEQVDEELRNGNDRGALSLIRDSKGRAGGVLCFGAARQVPQRLYRLDELKLNGIDPSAFLSPADITLSSIERNVQLVAAVGGLSAWIAFGLSQLQLLYLSLGLLFLWTLDLVSFDGGVRNLVLDTIGHNCSKKYHNRVIQHEAGHFLIAYLLGVLPKGFTLSSLDAFIKERALNVQAGTAFVDFEFVEEYYVALTAIYKSQLVALQKDPKFSVVPGFIQPLRAWLINRGKVTATMLNRFSCIALAGVATEFLLFGYSEGGVDDIGKLDKLLKSLGFTQKKADSQVRWAVLNTVSLLRRHEKARSRLAEAMSSGKSVGECIAVIEESIDIDDVQNKELDINVEVENG